MDFFHCRTSWILPVAMMAVAASNVSAQSFTCEGSALSRQVRAEGKTELVGDIVFDCRTQNGAPASNVANLQVTLGREVTNEVYNDTALRGVTLTVSQADGSGSAVVLGRKAGSNTVAWNGVPLNAAAG